MLMNEIKRIIIPVDGSSNSKKAVEKGAYLAKILGVNTTKIITINDTHQFISSVIIEDKLKKESQIFLDKFKKIAETYGVKVDTHLIAGKPAEEIINFVKQGDLIVMAYHDNTKRIDYVIEKSVSYQIVEKAPCSIVIIK